MIAKSEYTALIKDYVNILEKQVKGLTRENLIDFLEVWKTSEDEDMPQIIFGDSGKLMFKSPKNEITEITAEEILDIIDREKFQATGIITIREKEAS